MVLSVLEIAYKVALTENGLSNALALSWEISAVPYIMFLFTDYESTVQTRDVLKEERISVQPSNFLGWYYTSFICKLLFENHTKLD